jgi:hypothetical protein
MRGCLNQENMMTIWIRKHAPLANQQLELPLALTVQGRMFCNVVSHATNVIQIFPLKFLGLSE